MESVLDLAMSSPRKKVRRGEEFMKYKDSTNQAEEGLEGNGAETASRPSPPRPELGREVMTRYGK